MQVNYHEIKTILLNEINNAPSEHWATALLDFYKVLERKYGDHTPITENTKEKVKDYYNQQVEQNSIDIY